MFEISLVPDEHNEYVAVSMISELPEPPANTIE